MFLDDAVNCFRRLVEFCTFAFMKITEDLSPYEYEMPVDYADRMGVHYSALVSQKNKKRKGQFLTPPSIARFMGSMVSLEKTRITILDPGCGTAILSCALIENLVNSNYTIESIYLEAFDTDSEILPFTTLVLDYLKTWLEKKNISFKCSFIEKDFILFNAGALNNEDTLFSSEVSGSEFDFIISNPPYFKLNKEDQRAKVASVITKGQPNIYAIFMAIASKILSPNGQLVFITPRSYASGSYFKTFREFFFKNIRIEQVHIFDSRKDTFERDNVLQETIILKGVKSFQNGMGKPVLITSSKGINDLSMPHSKTYPQEQIIDLKSKEKILHLPVNDNEEEILNLFQSWDGALNKFNIQISTGPVVAFRATKFIREIYENSTIVLAPLIWLHNVNKMHLEWPVHKPKKGQYIQICEESQSLLVPNKNYILLRRFSAKDDKSRLIASPYLANSHDAEYIGIENKVNYIYRPKGNLDQTELFGLAAVLNSKLFDNYFRIFNGNVNVSATELREMPLPPLDLIKKIGNHLIQQSSDFKQEDIDNLIIQILLKKQEEFHEQNFRSTTDS